MVVTRKKEEMFLRGRRAIITRATQVMNTLPTDIATAQIYPPVCTHVSCESWNGRRGGGKGYASKDIPPSMCQRSANYCASLHWIYTSPLIHANRAYLVGIP